ncbi:gibberellin 3-beta-dioxygenase 2-like [Zingiber officinale]|uniref:Fe2OG dioxygenase domain-containing protein n=1 Tax=Zingiber officinale TaxID=94328 RepID=A0A8J5ET65_ZINOF|nr:gibberellin 3-beta-dioxygenase 2-like [Zingiber officinale]KAG6474245.1 hypothetical protein ZIOFF_068170 [Zingiber officinale]
MHSLSVSGQPSLLCQLEWKSLNQVPDSHIWPPDLLHHHPTSNIIPPSSSMPIIDLTAADSVVIPLIGRACETWGAFQITGHGVPLRLLDLVEAQTCRLFSLPSAHKLRAQRSPSGGVTGYGPALISSFFSKLFWSEGFTIVGSAQEDARKLWPNCFNDFCSAMEEYSKGMKDLSRRVIVLMLRSLGLSEEDIDEVGPLRGHDEVEPVLQLNYYPPCPEPDRTMGLADHTDSSLITIIHQSSCVTGLQLLHHDESDNPRPQWVEVPPISGALVVNVGDLFHIISNGRFHTVIHRAIVDRTWSRISVAYFCGPLAHFKVGPIQKIVDPNQGPAYPGITWPKYLSLKKKLHNETLASIRLPLAAKRQDDEKKVL